METEDPSDGVGVVCERVVVGGASFGGDTDTADDPALDEACEVVSMATSSLGATETGVSSRSLAVVGVAERVREEIIKFFVLAVALSNLLWISTAEELPQPLAGELG